MVPLLRRLAVESAHPHGNHGENIGEPRMNAPGEKTPAQPERTRITVDLSPAVLSLLDHVSHVTGVTRTQVVGQVLVDALPGLVARADEIQKRAIALHQVKRK